jgi:FkbM family methyltransferase
MNAIVNRPRSLAGVVERLGGPLIVVDVGAQALANEDHVYGPLRRLGVPLRVIGFEPQPDHAAARRALDGNDSMILEAFIGDGGVHRFHPASTDASSSLFPLDRVACGAVATLANLHDRPGAEVATRRLDDLLDGIGPVDFLKLDIEGAELMALRGAADVLSRTAVVQAETAFAAFRQGQPLFADVDTHLRAHGFELMRFHAPAMRPAATPSGAHGADRLMWADAVFFAEEAHVTDRALLVQAILASGIYGMHTVAERALALYDARHGTMLAVSYARPAAWTPGPATLRWAKEQTNAALRSASEVERAVQEMEAAGLPPHPDRPKCWDGFLAMLHAATTTPRDMPVLDAGAERYSNFLPGLRRLGFTDLTGINTAFTAEEVVDGIRYRPGDVTGSDLPDARFGFVACLSVVEHGVDLPAFLREQARLLRRGGHLFVSCDYWETPIDTAGLQAYGVPIRIFTREDLQAAMTVAEAAGLRLVGASNLDCAEKAVCWERFGLRYTFANMMWQRDGA